MMAIRPRGPSSSLCVTTYVGHEVRQAAQRMQRSMLSYSASSASNVIITRQGAVRAVVGPTEYDVLIRGGAVYDGSGGPPTVQDVAVNGDQVAAIGTGLGRGRLEIDARDLAVAPGFINMLSWATE